MFSLSRQNQGGLKARWFAIGPLLRPAVRCPSGGGRIKDRLMLPSAEPLRIALAELVDRQEAATLLGVSPRTLDRWHLLRIGPPRITLGGHKVRYRLSSLDAWLKGQEFLGPGNRVSDK
jgi:predicted DNA-binding transcriptional regulator AlpA